jgi:hypothetical protein
MGAIGACGAARKVSVWVLVLVAICGWAVRAEAATRHAAKRGAQPTVIQVAKAPVHSVVELPAAERAGAPGKAAVVDVPTLGDAGLLALAGALAAAGLLLLRRS